MTDINAEIITRRFEEMGARVKVEATDPAPRRLNNRTLLWPSGRREAPTRSAFTVDLRTDRSGQYFLLRYDDPSNIRMQVVDSRPDDRHLLLFVQNGDQKGKFLCGHDEREWFTCAIPGNSVRDVRTAKEALKPREVQQAELAAGVKPKDKNKRKNEGWLRQGEWFLVGVNDEEVRGYPILKNEPLRRGRGRPHMAQECIRKDGTTVYVCSKYPNGVIQAEFDKIVAADPKAARRMMWRTMVRDAKVYVRGNFSQPGGHKTLVLRDWHRVFPNTENKAPWSHAVVFLD